MGDDAHYTCSSLRLRRIKSDSAAGIFIYITIKYGILNPVEFTKEISFAERLGTSCSHRTLRICFVAMETLGGKK